MIQNNRYITNEYRILLRNATFVLSIILFILISTNITLTNIAPNWKIKLFTLFGIIMNFISSWLIYSTIKHFTDSREPIVIIKWISSYLCLVIELLPSMLFLYLNLDWKLLAIYGRIAISAHWSFSNILLPIIFIFLISIIYWILIIQLYKSSYIIHLITNKKKEIYGK